MMKEPHSNEKKTSLTLSQINIISQTKFKSKQENILHALDILVWFTFKFSINLNLNQEVEFFTCILGLSEVLPAAQSKREAHSTGVRPPWSVDTQDFVLTDRSLTRL